MSKKNKKKKKRLPPKASWIWIKNSAGKADAILTLLVLSFLITTGAYIISFIGTLDIGSFSFEFNPFDISYATAVVCPLTAAYVGRKWTDHQKTSEYDNLPEQPE